MARADLLIRLVQSGIRGDKASFRKVVEAIIAEERTKQHKVLAEKLEEMLKSWNSQRERMASASASWSAMDESDARAPISTVTGRLAGR